LIYINRSLTGRWASRIIIVIRLYITFVREYFEKRSQEKIKFITQGRLCELDVDECVRYMHTDLGCQNGAECKNTPGSYKCACATNWFGLHCTKRNNDCNGEMSSELCGNGVCINQPSTVGYTCICSQVSDSEGRLWEIVFILSCICILSLKGWTTTNSRQHPACTKDVDECKENKHTCSTNPPVECRNTRGSFTCGNCPEGK